MYLLTRRRPPAPRLPSSPTRRAAGQGPPPSWPLDPSALHAGGSAPRRIAGRWIGRVLLLQKERSEAALSPQHYSRCPVPFSLVVDFGFTSQCLVQSEIRNRFGYVSRGVC